MNKCNFFSNYWFHLLFNSVLFAIIAIGLVIHFEENDDVTMCLIANGGYSGTPDCHLVFINAIYGSLLVLFYSMTSSVEWYTLFFAMLHIVSMSVITSAIAADNKRSLYIKIIWLVFAYVIWIRLVLSLQFTTTAAISSLAGCILMLRNPYMKGYIMGGGLIFVGSLIRFEASALVVLLLTPLVFWRLRTNWKSYTPYIIVGILVLSALFFESLFYGNEEWKYYKNYNQARSEINDVNNANDISVYEALPSEINEDDYNLLLYYFPDPEIMTLDVLRQIKQNIVDIPVIDKLQNLKCLYKYALILSLIFLIILTIWASPNDKVSRLFFLLGYYLFMCSIVCYLGILFEFKQRVFFVILISTMTVLYGIIETYNKMWGAMLFSLCLLLMSGKYAKQIYGQFQLDKRLRHEWIDLQQPVMCVVPLDCYVMSFGAEMHIELQSPWRIKDLYPHFVGRGWTTAMPINKSIAWSNKDLLQSNIYIFTTKDNLGYDLINMLQNSIENHYKIRTSYQVYSENNKYQLIQLTQL